ncbi:MAG: glycine dehydrogenase, partial [Verrucomicrobiota bacterium]|nr:glycine dehydrogenase [Verrucomicrobiota bacterium]
PIEDSQGCLEVLYEIQEWLRKITGLAAVTTQPVAGAQGELVGIKLFQAYHRDRGDNERNVIFIPKSAHGTNFATAVTAGFSASGGIVHLEALPDGRIDPDFLDAKLAEHGERLCGIMITNPNTSGVLETDFKVIADKVHAAGGLVYMDGANMNAIAGWVDLGAMGVDAVHNNLHKTWTIPHGGGGPGDAIVAVSKPLVDFLPGHQFVRGEDNLIRPEKPIKSIGSFHRHWGNFAHKVRAYTYLLRLGREGIPRMSAIAVLAARYLYERLRSTYPTLPAGASKIPRMHEFILTLEEHTFEKAEAAGIPSAKNKRQEAPYSMDANLLHISYEGLALEDP